MIADVLSVYGDEAAPHKKSVRNIGYNIGNLLKWWGRKTVAEITEKSCRAYASERPRMAAQADLKVLKSAVTYWHKSEYGPLQFEPVFWKPKNNPPRSRWLTKGEAARLLRAAKPYLHLRRLILLGLHTGSRPGVLLALRWSQVDLHGGILHRIPQDAPQDEKKRAPSIRLGRKLFGHMRRWKRIDGDAEFVCHLDGRAVEDPHASWPKVVKAAKLKGITRHTLRHTRATWMMQADVPIWEAAGFLGMSVKTLESIYGHHAPSHQERAANI